MSNLSGSEKASLQDRLAGRQDFFAGLLFAGLLINRVFDPAGARLASRNDSDYAAAH